MEALCAYDDSSSDEAEAPVRASPLTKPAPREAGLVPGHIYVELPPRLTAAAGNDFSRLQRGFMSWFDARLGEAGAGTLSARFSALPPPEQYIETPLHISLSRYFELRPHMLDGFLAAVRRLLDRGGARACEVSLEGCQIFLPSAPAGRVVYLGMLVGAGRSSVLRLIECVDEAMREHGLAPFYSPPEPHVSVAAAALRAAGSAGCGADSREAEPVAAAAEAATRDAATARSNPTSGAVSEDARRACRAADAATRSGSEAAGAPHASLPRPAKRARHEAPAAAALGMPLASTGRASESGIARPLPCLATGDLLTSAAEAGLGAIPSPLFAVSTICVKLGRRLFRLELPA